MFDLFKLENFLDSVHSSVVTRRWAQLFTAFVRVLLGVSFIPPSIPKIMHRPFTLIPDTHPVGAYFSALYNTGYYYDFLGWTQLTAAIFLIIPRTAHVGTLLFFPIIVNIAVLTNSVGFKGTWLVTLLMALAALYLVCWEYDRLKPFFFSNRDLRTVPLPYQFITIPLFFAAGGFALNLVFRMLLIGNLKDYLWAGGILSAIGFGFGIIVAFHFHYMAVGKVNSNTNKTTNSE
ncbi:hypothetical protein [Leptolyngbya sp. 7M]|uniref:hypothetical protein n=1 Tax=Leptolyngbya sp. 7M TaxID=2812896 RepID=UPI001B8B7B4B|nr:hypothetical protein [Leptolyngbya sp. 7M]QYO66306.1 hypothetical protein JVX88_05765 [Leptolyngbya sp. 7M]